MLRIINLFKSFFIRVKSCFYVGATDILPEPLSSEDEEAFILLKDKGDNHAREMLIEHNLRLVVFLAKKYENTGVDLEDLVSIGKNIKLATYISRCIDNEILMYLRKNKKIRQEVSIDQALSYDGDGNELHLEDIIGTDKDLVSKNIEEKNDKSLMIKEILNLKPRDRDIMVLRYGLLGNDEFTQKEVAEKLGISQSYISRIEKKVIKKLKCLVSAWLCVIY